MAMGTPKWEAEGDQHGQLRERPNLWPAPSLREAVNPGFLDLLKASLVQFGPRKVITSYLGGCWDTFFVFASWGLVENPHLTAKI